MFRPERMQKIVFSALLGTALVIGGGVFAGLRAGNALRCFEEKTIATFYSGFLLLGIAWLCFQMRRLRHVAPGRTFWKPETAIWGLMALGFAFLAVDEVAEVHESMDKLIHRVFRLRETNLTDRIDDMIVGLYGLTGIGALFAYRKELTRHKHVAPFLAAGIILFFAMVALDALTNRMDVLRAVFKANLTADLVTVLVVAEESCKLYASASFFLGLYSAVHRARPASHPAIA